MGKLSYTGKLTLSIKMDKVLKYCEPKCLREDLQHHVKNELMHCCEGMINGDFGGNYCDSWERILFLELEREGIVKLKPEFYDDF